MSELPSYDCVPSDKQILLAEPVILAEIDLSLFQAQICSVSHKILHAKTFK